MLYRITSWNLFTMLLFTSLNEYDNENCLLLGLMVGFEIIDQNIRKD